MATTYIQNSVIPQNVKILLVDSDAYSLRVNGDLLNSYKYDVTAVGHPVSAIHMLREERTPYDIVISAINLPTMDGLELMDYVVRIKRIPVILMSAMEEEETMILRAVHEEAKDFLVNPLRAEDIQIIWHHVLRHRRFIISNSSQSAVSGHDGAGSFNSALPTNRTEDGSAVRYNNYDEETEAGPLTSAGKKRRFAWTTEMKKLFIAAVTRLGPEAATPAKVLELMQNTHISRKQVASKLQKYRIYLYKQEEKLRRPKSLPVEPLVLQYPTAPPKNLRKRRRRAKQALSSTHQTTKMIATNEMLEFTLPQPQLGSPHTPFCSPSRAIGQQAHVGSIHCPQVTPLNQIPLSIGHSWITSFPHRKECLGVEGIPYGLYQRYQSSSPNIWTPSLHFQHNSLTNSQAFPNLREGDTHLAISRSKESMRERQHEVPPSCRLDYERMVSDTPFLDDILSSFSASEWAGEDPFEELAAETTGFIYHDLTKESIFAPQVLSSSRTEGIDQLPMNISQFYQFPETIFSDIHGVDSMVMPSHFLNPQAQMNNFGYVGTFGSNFFVDAMNIEEDVNMEEDLNVDDLIIPNDSQLHASELDDLFPKENQT